MTTLSDVRLLTPTASPLSPASLSEPLLTPDDVAALLGTKRTTVYELARHGRLPFVNVSRALRFPRTHISKRGSTASATCGRHGGV